MMGRYVYLCIFVSYFLLCPSDKLGAQSGWSTSNRSDGLPKDFKGHFTKSGNNKQGSMTETARRRLYLVWTTDTVEKLAPVLGAHSDFLHPNIIAHV